MKIVVRPEKPSNRQLTKSCRSTVWASIIFFCWYIEFLIIAIIQFTPVVLRNLTELFKQLKSNKDIIPRFLHTSLPYTINEQIVSGSTQVFFTISKSTNIPICVKLWQKQHWDEEREKQIQYFLEGFHYNQCNAPGVYLGIARVEHGNEQSKTLQRSGMIFLPDARKLKDGEYAVVMRKLDHQWRLDVRLFSQDEPLNTQVGMEFLAQGVARLHNNAKSSSAEMGDIETLNKKLTFNIGRLNKALDKLVQENNLTSEVASNYRGIGDTLKLAFKDLQDNFRERHAHHHIKRCHGDLKLTNLWVRPSSKKNHAQQLLALDCIDFKPDFCHIDPLSDIAMLIVDLQRHLDLHAKQEMLVKKEELVAAFLKTYYQETKEEQAKVSKLLQFYMTEKAIVCAYVSVLFDSAPEIGIHFLKLADNYAQQLRSLLVITKPSPSSSTQAATISPLAQPLSR